uniref:RabBD domain-containing protein n=1 Tax=Sparus aurata TaxID=8175 RepID=A0A671UUH4_SPAAU
MIRDSFNMDLSLLQALERERVLEVLRRDKQLRIIEEDRIRRMKCELQELRRRGAKSFTRQYGERTCARCQRPLGKFWNLGAVCRGCSHRICSRCRVGAADWKCTVCHAYREVKIRSGEWFLEQRARKFPLATGLLTRFRQQVFTVDLFLISLSRLIIKTPLISSGSATSSHKIWMIRAVFFFVFFKP